MNHVRQLASRLIPLLCLTLQAGCNGRSGPTLPGGTATYVFRGAVVKDANRNGTVSVVGAVTDDTTVSTTILAFAGDTLDFNDPAFQFFAGIDSVFSHLQTPVTSLPAGQYRLFFTDPGGQRDSIMTAVSDTFSIISMDPPNHLLQGLDQVTVDWSPTTNVTGYILAAVKETLPYTGKGYSAVVSSGINSGTIPPEAFALAGVNTPDTGLYNIYVYAYFGAPDSLLVHRLLPTPFPLQPADNIDREVISGRFGTITVTKRDTLRVMLLNN